ncbi:hypothetical protein EON64_05140 [archaeon]|nr:MAG: hypothetical protein EON64_05140 [archaeon]
METLNDKNATTLAIARNLKAKALEYHLQGGVKQLYQAVGLCHKSLDLLEDSPLSAFKREAWWMEEAKSCKSALDTVNESIREEESVLNGNEAPICKKTSAVWRNVVLVALCWLGAGLIASYSVELLDSGYLAWVGLPSRTQVQDARLQALEERILQLLTASAMAEIERNSCCSNSKPEPLQDPQPAPSCFDSSASGVNNSDEHSRQFFSPCQFHDCAFWMDAADPTTYVSSGNAISLWRSKVDEINFTGTAIISAFLNNLPMLTLPASSDLTAAVSYKSARRTVFSVQVMGDASASNFVLNDVHGSGIQFYSYEGSANLELCRNQHNILVTAVTKTIPIFGKASLTVGSITPGDAGLYINGVLARASSSHPLDAFVPGTTTTQRIGGGAQISIAEIIVYDEALTRAERQEVEGYLSWKWGLYPNLPDNHPYKTTPPTGSGIIAGLDKVPLRCVTAVPDVDYFGNDLFALFVESLAACQLRCCEEPRCKAYTYRVEDNHCWLKSAVAQVPALFSGAFSGVKPVPMTWSVHGKLPTVDSLVHYDFVDLAASIGQNIDLRLELAIRHGGLSLSLSSQINGQWLSNTQYASVELLATAPGYPVEFKVLADASGFRVVSALDIPIVTTNRLGVTSDLYQYRRPISGSFVVTRSSNIDTSISLPTISTGQLGNSEVVARFYSGCYFNNAELQLRPGFYSLDSLASLSHFQANNISSVQVPPGYRVVLFQQDLGSDSLTLMQNAPCLLQNTFSNGVSALNQVSALIIEPHPKPTPWAQLYRNSNQNRCIVRRNVAGEIECHGQDSINCDWTHTDSDTDASLFAAKVSSSPLQCGDRHTQAYSGDGYSTPDHWCSVGRHMFDSLSIQPFTKSPTGFDDSGTHKCFTGFTLEQAIASCRGRPDCSSVMWERNSSGEACLVLGPKASFQRSRKWIGYSKKDTSADNGGQYPMQDYLE